MYNMALELEDYKKLEETEKKPYFTQRLNEADRAEIRAEAIKDFISTLELLWEKGYDFDTAIRIMKGEISSN